MKNWLPEADEVDITESTDFTASGDRTHENYKIPYDGKKF